MASSDPIPFIAEVTHPYFRFFDLPSELRRKILCLALKVESRSNSGQDHLTGQTIDLHPDNYRRIAPLLRTFTTSRRFHEEAYPIFYGTHTFRIFPTNGRFFGDRIQPLLSRLPSHYRAALLSLQLRLGPGWTKPPKSWKVDDSLGLQQAASVRKLDVFIEIDPSHNNFKGFRISKEFFTNFSSNILIGIMERLSALEKIDLDGNPSVNGDGPLVTRLKEEASQRGMRVSWARNREILSDEVVKRVRKLAIIESVHAHKKHDVE